MMYEVTGFIKIPMTVKVESDTPEKALDIGKEMLGDGEGVPGDQFDDIQFTVWDGETGHFFEGSY
jgi:hypothetical protein